MSRPPERRVVRPPRRSLREIIEQQLDKLLVLANNRLLEDDEIKLLKTISDISSAFPPAELETTAEETEKSSHKHQASVAELMKLVDGKK